MERRARCRSTSASSAIRLTWLTPFKKLQICGEQISESEQAIGRVGAHLVQRDVPAGVLLRLQRRDSYWYIPVVDLARVDVEGSEEDLEIRVADSNARFRNVVDIHVELLQQVIHREVRWWRG